MNDGNTGAGYIPFTPISSDALTENEPMTADYHNEVVTDGLYTDDPRLINPVPADHKLYHPSTDPSNWNEAEMREFFAKVASAVVNASEQAKVIEAIRAQQVEDHARLHNLESLVSTHLQTIDALREAVRVTAEERDNARDEMNRLRTEVDAWQITFNEKAEAYNERGATIHEHETTIHELRQQLHDANVQCDSLYRDNDKFAARIHELEAASKAAQQTIVDLQHTVYNLRDALRGVKEDRAVEVAQNEAHKAHIIEQATMLEHYETQLDQVRKALA